MKRDPWTTVLRRRLNRDLTWTRAEPALAAKLAAAPIVAVAVDLADGPAPVNEALHVAAGRILATLPSARLACVNVLNQGRITLDTTLDAHGHNKHIDRLVALRHWAEPLKLEDHRLTVHVLEAIDPASAILEFAQANRRSHLDRRATKLVAWAGCSVGVSGRVVAEASCTVTVVRPSRLGDQDQPPSDVEASRDTRPNGPPGSS